MQACELEGSCLIYLARRDKSLIGRCVVVQQKHGHAVEKRHKALIMVQYCYLSYTVEMLS